MTNVYLNLLTASPVYDYTVLRTETTTIKDLDFNVIKVFKVYLDVSKALVRAKKSWEEEEEEERGKLGEHLDWHLCSPIRFSLSESMKEKGLVPTEYDVYAPKEFSNHSSQGWKTLVVDFYHK